MIQFLLLIARPYYTSFSTPRKLILLSIDTVPIKRLPYFPFHATETQHVTPTLHCQLDDHYVPTTRQLDCERRQQLGLPQLQVDDLPLRTNYTTTFPFSLRPNYTTTWPNSVFLSFFHFLSTFILPTLYILVLVSFFVVWFHGLICC